jgi:hypothetical protein
LIALELIRTGRIKRPFLFVPMYRVSTDEDTASVRTVYEAIRKEAVGVHPLVESKGMLKNAASLAGILLTCTLRRGTVFVSVLNSYSFALALRVNPFCKLMSFDDGTANLETRDEGYLSMKPLPPGGFKRLAARNLFPQGAAAYCRSRTLKHFTIYPGRPNVVPPDKLIPVELGWSSYLTDSDKLLIPKEVRKILIGTVYDDLEESRWRPGYQWAISRCDIYLPHPRQRTQPRNLGKVVETSAPAESLVSYVLDQSDATLTLYHFGSSVAIRFATHERVICVDLLDADWAKGGIPVSGPFAEEAP